MLITELGPMRFAAEGSPADCVLAALYDVMPDPPDLVLCGVNRGNNAGENVLYSGTIGGAMEAALQGLPAIALSQFMGPGNRDLEDPFELGAPAWRGRDCQASVAGAVGRQRLPAVLFRSTSRRCLRLRPSPQSWRHRATGAAPRFSCEPHLSPSGKRFLWIKGGEQEIASANGSDVERNLAGHITVTPMSCDLTLHDALGPLEEALK